MFWLRVREVQQRLLSRAGWYPARTKAGGLSIRPILMV